MCKSEIPKTFSTVVLEKDGDHFDRTCKNEEPLQRVKEKRNILKKQKEGRLTGLVTSCIDNAF